MKNRSFAALAAFLSFFLWSCKKEKTPIVTPACIADQIEAYKLDHCQSDSAKITRFETALGPVWLFDYNFCCCDYPSPILDSTCTEICFLGGFAGIDSCKIDGKPLILKNPVIVWKK